MTLARTFTLKNSLLSIRDPPLGQIVGGKFNGYRITGDNANVVFTHLAGYMGQNRMAVLKLHAKLRARQGLDNRPRKLDDFL